jgi:hypothetical protein
MVVSPCCWYSVLQEQAITNIFPLFDLLNQNFIILLTEQVISVLPLTTGGIPLQPDSVMREKVGVIIRSAIP